MFGYVIVFIVTEILVWDLLSKLINTIKTAIMARCYSKCTKDMEKYLKNMEFEWNNKNKEEE